MTSLVQIVETTADKTDVLADEKNTVRLHHAPILFKALSSASLTPIVTATSCTSSNLVLSTATTYTINRARSNKKGNCFMIEPEVTVGRYVREGDIYFIHQPTLHCQSGLPRTMRNGDNKHAPPVAVFNTKTGWGSWTLHYGDVLAKEGVIDGRGLVSEKYGTPKGENGTLKGFKVVKRHRGDSGKSWYEDRLQQLGETKSIVNNERIVDEIEPILEDDVDGNKRKVELEDTDMTDLTVRPEETVVLRWVHPFSLSTREYAFAWRGYQFLWKGTCDVDVPHSSNILKFFLKLNHLKLVVLLPDTSSSDIFKTVTRVPIKSSTASFNSKKGDMNVRVREMREQKDTWTEIVLARFASNANPKTVGKLVLYDEALEKFVETYLSTSSDLNSTAEEKPELIITKNTLNKSTVQSRNVVDNNLGDAKECGMGEVPRSSEKDVKRMREIILSTATCMIIAEFLKRKLTRQVIQLLISAGTSWN